MAMRHALTTLALAAGLTTAAAPTSHLTPTPCPVPVPPTATNVRCGLVDVPLRYDSAATAKNKLAVAVIASKKPTRTPLMILGGGPGEKLIASLPALAALPADDPLVAGRDVILVDQRGVGFSKPALECPEVVGPLVDLTALPEQQAARTSAGVTACARRLSHDRVDFSAYDTLNNARDLGQVVAALGYPKVDLFGGSYGALLALQAERGNPDWIAHVAVASLTPAERNFFLDIGRSFQGSLDALRAACRADMMCASSYGDIATKLNRVVEKYAKSPKLMTIVDRATERSVRAMVSGELIASRLLSLLYFRSSLAYVPQLIDRFSNGDFSALVAGAGGPPPTAEHVVR
ncbi:alpha/beta fold hydrolase [Fodinicola acaciae]|uniref:alpha/beta fold hydrolase n=1 Tax=Fodinicola acaciae TaxID=2681555 RepID=UPI0013D7B1EC|nr:alpha/beta fold hydrolase [Fodinicola acaciae]